MRTTHDEVMDLFADPATHGLAAPVAHKRTHAAIVFLAGPFAYKLKLPVTYDYLDFSTPQLRRQALTRELELNRPTAPQIYDRLVPVTREADGSLSLDGAGEPVEWALRMARFPEGAELSAVAARGGLDDGLAAALGREIAAMHARASRRDDDPVALVGEIVEELERAFARMGDRLDPAAIVLFGERARASLARARPLLRARARGGFLRRCHGDLHLRNVVVIEGRPLPFDALEFDERLGTMDVLYDLAFLLMDLDHAGLHRAANIVMNRYLFHAAEDAHLDALALLPLFLALRAAIRAMVGVQAARRAGAGAEEASRARGYLARACAFLAPPPPILVAVGGLSGTGKSTLAAALAPELGPAPGAVHLRSDLTRKAMFGCEEFEKLPPEAYAPGAGRTVYGKLRARAARALAAGHAVVLDAVHLTQQDRGETRAVARRAGCRFAGLWLEAPPETLLARVAARTHDASDADAAVVRLQIEAGADAGDWRIVLASGSPEVTLATARRALAEGSSRRDEPQ
jgi:aminoglycoside phosphotransferase family enzyme/predicted kinase